MPKVYIPHNVFRFDHATQSKVPAYNFQPALLFGELTPVLSSEDNLFMYQECVNKCQKALADCKPDDFLLPVGDPVIMSICAHIMAGKNSVIKMLKWDKYMKRYIPVDLKFN